MSFDHSAYEFPVFITSAIVKSSDTDEILNLLKLSTILS